MISVQAPSNIAIIKYMGKKPGSHNLPENPSLSMTLSKLQTRVVFSQKNTLKWIFAPSETFSWSPKAIEKTLGFFAKCDEQLPDLFSVFQVPYVKPEPCEILSENTFPAGAGIASSASSFAALTLAYAAASVESGARENFKQQFLSDLKLKQALAQISRRGSGSSCRSFFGPWVYWSEDEIKPVSFSWPDLCDLVVVFDAAEKAVSSSEAHQRVKTSPLWSARLMNVTKRLEKILSCSFEEASILITDEALEMHELFHTSTPSFSYMNDETKRFLDFYQARKNSLPTAAFTLDAGPNPHLLTPVGSVQVWSQEITRIFPHARILIDHAGQGVDFL